MPTINYDMPYGEKIIVCLGYFDCAHIGHLSLIEQAKKDARQSDCKVGIFTFKNNPFDYFGKNAKSIYNLSDREFIFNNLKIDVVLQAQFDSDFLNMDSVDFLDALKQNKNIIEIVVGKDYTYGKAAQGNISTLLEYCSQNGIILKVVDIIMSDGKKVSSTLIRQLLEEGDIERTNALLSMPYFISGIVLKGRHDGSKMGTPTVNIPLSNDKLKIKSGVYATRVCFEGKSFPAVTNVGTHPTFCDECENCESHLIDYSGDLYGKEIRVKFFKRLRDIQKFENKEDLKMQILKDIEIAKEILK